MCNVIPNRRMAFTLCLSVLVAGCGIKWATNRVLSNPDAIAKVGAVYDVLTPRDTTEKLFFIQGDSIVVEKTDTIIQNNVSMTDSSNSHTNTVYVTKQIRVSKTDTIIRQMPPDNRHLARLKDSITHYKAITDRLIGKEANYIAQVKTAEKRLIWMAAGLLLLGTIIGLLLRFKIKL